MAASNRTIQEDGAAASVDLVEWYFEQGQLDQTLDWSEGAIPTYPDVAPRTLYGLHNSFTRAFKMAHPGGAFNYTQKLGQLFNI